MNTNNNDGTKTGKLLLQKQQISRADLDTVTGGGSFSKFITKISRKISHSGSSSSTSSSSNSSNSGGNESQNG